MKEYLIIGVNENATPEEIDNAYRQKKEMYSEMRFSAGQEGEDAVNKLDELERAYQYVKSIPYSNSIENQYEEIKNLLNQNQLAKAQEKLDSINERSGEWHYLQSILYYKKSWYVESKKQLEMACKVEPDNEKFANALKDVNQIIGRKTVEVANYSYNNSSNEQNTKTNRNPSANPTCTGSCCGDMCLANCCCNCCMNGCCNM